MPARLRPSAVQLTLASLVAIVAFAVSGAIVLGADRALASNVTCGDTITADTALNRNLVNCPNNGIVIGADDVTVDLNGHTVAGNGEPVKPCPQDVACDVGILNDGHDGVTVMHGSVREFEVGAFARMTRHNRLLGISSSRNRFGMVIANSTGGLIRNSSGRRSVEDGMVLFGSARNRILSSSFRRNHNLGIVVTESINNLLKRNLFSRNDLAAILVENGDRNEMRRNRCIRTGSCIIVGPGNHNTIARNRIFRGTDAIRIEEGRGNLVARNTLVHVRGPGIRLGLEQPEIGGVNSVVRRNVVRGSGNDAFLVNQQDHHSLLKRNFAVGAGDDGFDIESRSTKLTGNRAMSNDELGIEGIGGVIDGGGNLARHNGDPRQCTYIACLVERINRGRSR